MQKMQLSVEPDELEWKILVQGRIQGVGFRPFIYRLAHQQGLTGYVRNVSDQVEIIIYANEIQKNTFIHALETSHPPFARPVISSVTYRAAPRGKTFQIRHSESTSAKNIVISPDQSICDECLDELLDPANRRYRYPFINCTQCGPRYTIIHATPYDRDNTSMSTFTMCPDCLKEYNNPADRRFHAQPNACPACGPSVSFHFDNKTCYEDAIEQCVKALKDGLIVAIKGVGGYHLACDATNSSAVENLRQRKDRPDKPFAVMLPYDRNNRAERIHQYANVTELEVSTLLSPERPIVLADRTDSGTISQRVSGKLNRIGVMLPYSPLHHILMQAIKRPLVMTSANISGEPVMTDSQDLERLSKIYDAVLDHNRPIVRPCDDSVVQQIGNYIQPVRLGRGYAPSPVKLPIKLAQPVIAVGGHLKNSIALAWDNQAVIAPHIGDLSSARSQQVFEQVIQDLQQLYGINAERIIHDAHPDYASTRWTKNTKLPTYAIYHHYAHASAASGAAGIPENMLVYAWDGTGLGPDGTIWGGETFIGRPGKWQRLATLKSFRLPGGDKAARECWRSAAGILWQMELSHQLLQEIDPLLYQAWNKGIQSPLCSSAGRLLDAVSAIADICTQASYEGQAPMQMESLVEQLSDSEPMQRTNGIDSDFIYDWQAMIGRIMSMDDPISVSEYVYSTFASTMTDQALQARSLYGIEDIGFHGGIFQNRQLLSYISEELTQQGFNVHHDISIPVNDGGLCYGQLIEYSYQQNQDQDQH